MKFGVFGLFYSCGDASLFRAWRIDCIGVITDPVTKLCAIQERDQPRKVDSVEGVLSVFLLLKSDPLADAQSVLRRKGACRANQALDQRTLGREVPSARLAKQLCEEGRQDLGGEAVLVEDAAHGLHDHPGDFCLVEKELGGSNRQGALHDVDPERVQVGWSQGDQRSEPERLEHALGDVHVRHLEAPQHPPQQLRDGRLVAQRHEARAIRADELLRQPSRGELLQKVAAQRTAQRVEEQRAFEGKQRIQQRRREILRGNGVEELLEIVERLDVADHVADVGGVELERRSGAGEPAEKVRGQRGGQRGLVERAQGEVAIDGDAVRQQAGVAKRLECGGEVFDGRWLVIGVQ